MGLTPVEIKVTVSGGTASTTGPMGYNTFGLIKMADNALHRSKAGGHNRITCSD